MDLCKDALENSGNYYSLYESVMENGSLCPVLFKSYAVYATRGIITNMIPAVDNVFHTSHGRPITDAILVQEETPTETPDEAEATAETDPETTEEAAQTAE